MRTCLKILKIFSICIERCFTSLSHYLCGKVMDLTPELYMNHQESSINSHDMIILAYVHGKREKRTPTY